jgi:hypothetical protein
MAKSLQKMFPEAIMQHELNQIQDITNAINERAKKVRDQEIIRTDSSPSSVDLGAAAEQRTYNGK